MVLPASPPDDALGPAAPGWLRRLKVSFGLSRAGLLVLVDHARLERLGEVVRTLLPLAPELEVHTEAAALADAPPGSAHVLLARAEDADWLNLNRPLFSSRALRVVLFCTREVSVGLLRGAVDFMDWVSLRLDCPAGPPPFAVAGLRHAVAAGVPGIVWAGGDLEASFSEALPRRTLRRVSAARPYAELVVEAKSRGTREWLAWTDVDGDFRLRRVRWALAEARSRNRSILVEPKVRSPGWWEVHGQLMEPTEAWMHLRNTGAQHPSRLAALVDLEPNAIQLMDLLLKRGVKEHVLEEKAQGASDPGAAMGQLSLMMGIVAKEQGVRGSAPPPAMRAIRPQRRLARNSRTVELQALETRLSLGEQLDAEEAEWWAAWAKKCPPPFWLEGSPEQGAVAEALLRQSQDSERWAQVATIAITLGDFDIAHEWSRHAMATDPMNWVLLFASLRGQGRFVDAELLLRRQLAQNEQQSDSAQAWTLHELGHVLHQQGRYTEAETALRQALSFSEKSAATQPLEHGASLSALAKALEQQGRYTEAEDVIRQALLLTENAVGAQTAEHGSLLHELARMLERKGRYAEAEDTLRRAMTITEHTLGPQHLNYAASLHELARMIEKQGGYAEAEQLLRESLRIIEQSLGPKHPDLAVALHGLAMVLGNQGRYTEAEDMMRQSLDIKERALGPRHPQLCATLANFGFNLTRQGRPQDGEPFISRSVEIARETWGLHHPETAQGLSLLSLTQAKLKKPEAVTTANQAVDALVHSLGEEHPLVKASLPRLRRIIAGEE